MSEENQVNDLLSQHRLALDEYRRWDEKVKALLKGRRVRDLSAEDMAAYKEAAARRDLAYDQMRHLERLLLDDIPGASTGQFPRPDFDTPPDEDD